MIKIKKILSFISIITSIISVILTINIPIIKKSIGTIIFSPFNYNYDGIYSIIVLIGSLLLFFYTSKGTEDVNINRFKVLLSFTFLLSLMSVIIIK